MMTPMTEKDIALHSATVKIAENSYPTAYEWICLCGAVARELHLTKKAALLHFYQQHAHPDAEIPDHTPTFSKDEIGLTHWTCACRANSYRGLLNEHRARQSHTQHVTSSLLAHYHHLDRIHEVETRQARRAKEILDHLL